MATPTMAILRVLRARREEAPPPTTNFSDYEPEYREVLEAIRSLGGDPTIDELTDWMVDRTHETGELPTPASVRKRALLICDERGVDVPDDSPIRK